MLSKNKICISVADTNATRELNLIKANWLWLQRQTAINNSTFKYEQEIGRAAVSEWKDAYNKNHGIKITNILQENVSLCLHSC